MEPRPPTLPACTKTLLLQHAAAQRSRSRTKANPYDPTDLVPDHADPSILVSDAGLDRGPIELIRQLRDLVLEGTRNTRYDTQAARPHLRNKTQCPLDHYFHHNLLAPEDRALNTAYWRTGRRLRADWRTAGYQPRLTGSMVQGSRSTACDAPESALDAIDRLAAALRLVAPVPRTCVVAVCLADQSAVDWAKLRPWPKPAAALDFLRLGLEAVREHYARLDALARTRAA